MGFLSGLPITVGTGRAVLVFYVRGYKERHVVNSADICCPIFLPLRGDYSDYGTIENVDLDENVQHIEEMFGTDIESIINAVDDNIVERHDHDKVVMKKNNDLFKELSYGLEREDVYDFVVNMKKRPAVMVTGVGKYWLDRLGFVRKGNTRSERHTEKWVHPDLKDVYLASDGHYSHFMKNGKEMSFASVYGTYSPFQVIKAMEEMGVKVEISDDVLNKNYEELSWEITQEHIGAAMARLKETEQKVQIAKDNGLEISGLERKEYLDAMMYMHREERYFEGVGNFYSVAFHDSTKTKRYMDELIFRPELKKQTIDFARFNNNMQRLNAHYFTSNYGNQQQDFDMHVALHRGFADIMQVVSDRIKAEYEKMEEEQTEN